MRDDFSELRMALLSIQRAAVERGDASSEPDTKIAMAAVDRLEAKTRAYAALERGLATRQTMRGVADLFVHFLTYVRQDLRLGTDRERDQPIYRMLDELYDTAKQLRY